MSSVSQISATGVKRRLPVPAFGVDVNFCRNPSCSQFSVPPDPRDGRGLNLPQDGVNLLRGTVKGSGDGKYFECGVCRGRNTLKNNRAIVEEYRRLREMQRADTKRVSCQRDGCPNYGRSYLKHPERYSKAGRTDAGHQRYICKACRSTFTVGHPARNHRCQSKNGRVLKLFVHGTSFSKISEIEDLSLRDVYRKIDFIYDQVKAFTAEREGDLRQTDWDKVGRRFATDSQTLTLNWPNRRKKASVSVQHLCTAHANSNYIVLGHLQFDPRIKMQEIDAEMALNGDLFVERCYRQQGRLWTAAEFKAYLDKIVGKVAFDREEAPEVNCDLQLPHQGALVRQDIQQYAHALAIRRMLSNSDSRFVFVQDADPGLSKAFVAAFAPEICAGRVDVATVSFNKYEVNDEREFLYAQGRKLLRDTLGLSAQELDSLPGFVLNEELDREIQKQLADHPIGAPFSWPYHSKSEPMRFVHLLTDRVQLAPDRRARLMRLATLRSVDSYFHKVRSNVRPAFRPPSTPSGNGRVWHRYFLYNPEMLVKLIEIYRFHHNWMGTRNTKETPAMKMGLARGKIYERDLFS